MDFNILHLSDLHISTKTDMLSKLLSDIKEQTIDIHDIVVVVTGDIVDKGIYDETVKTNVLNFFGELREILNDKFKACFIVPGNHDKTQTISGNILTETLSQTKEELVLETNDWMYQLLSYQNFLSLEDDIYKILFPVNAKIPFSHANTYGIEEYKSYESTILFIKIDTAWCSLGGSVDKRRLRISKTQLDELTTLYKEKCKSNEHKKIFTIALCHHPLNWLSENDEAMLYSYLTNSDYLNVDVLLCGHTHDVDIQNLFSNTHQITTFVTGIGWGEKTPAEKRDGHRYSLYIFNLRRNSCEVIVRKTDLRGNFDIDRDFFPDKMSKDKGRLLLPILPRNSHPFIKIPSCSEKKLLNIPLFIDNNILDSINEYHLRISSIKMHMAEFVAQMTRNAIWDLNTIQEFSDENKRDILRDYFYNNNDNGNIAKIMNCNQEYIFDLFTSLLYEFCNWFIQSFKDIFEKEENLRILFRIYNKKYKQICYQSKTNIENEVEIDKKYSKDDLARDISFDGMISKSFEMNSPLVYSSNSWYNSFEPDRWKNYMCIIPSYEGMQVFTSGTHAYNRKEIPYILCTIAICSEKNSIFLDILNYINIKECISELIKTFTNTFKLNLDSYKDYLIDKKLI